MPDLQPEIPDDFIPREWFPILLQYEDGDIHNPETIVAFTIDGVDNERFYKILDQNVKLSD